jgi:hypothetical protein
MKLNVKFINRIILFSFVFLFIVLQNFYFLSDIPFANKILAAAGNFSDENSNPMSITFDLEEENISEKTNFKLKNVQINGFEKIQSVTISLPKEIHFAQNIDEDNHPSGWQTQSTDDNLTRNYLLTSNKEAGTVKNYLENLIFVVNNEKQGFEDKIEVIISVEEIAARLASRPGEDQKIHYYKFVPGKVTWMQAYNAAKNETFKGLRGYLATITTQEEQDFIYNSIAKYRGWLGGTRLVFANENKINDEDEIAEILSGNYLINNDKWYWACGPEKGEIFTIGISGLGNKNDPRRHPDEAYSNWTASQEPNNQGNEMCLQFAWSNDQWNDLPGDNTGYIDGYYIEFSEYGDQHEIHDGNSKTMASYFIKIKRNLFSVLYDPNGGNEQVFEDNKFYAAGETAVVRFDNIPVKEGYKFLGWSINKKDLYSMYSFDKSEEDIQFIMPEKDVILYAIWGKPEESFPKEKSEESFWESGAESFPEYEFEKTLNPNTSFQKNPVILIISVMAASLSVLFIIFKKREIGFWY